MARRRKGEETRQRILQAALKLFSSRGYAGTSTRAIAREAEVAESTIFHHFPSKKDLLFAVLEPILLGSLTVVQNESQQLPLQQALSLILRQRLDLVEQNRDLFKLLALEAAVQPQLRKHLLTKLVLPLRAAALKLLEERLKRKLSPAERTALGQVLFGTLFSALLYKYLLKPELPEEPEVEEVLPAMLELILKGVKADA